MLTLKEVPDSVKINLNPKTYHICTTPHNDGVRGTVNYILCDLEREGLQTKNYRKKHGRESRRGIRGILGLPTL